VRTGEINQSLDWVPTSDLDMLSTVFGELNNIKLINLFSDKCTPKDLDKMENDYAKDLAACSLVTKARLNRYVKNARKEKEITEESPDKNPGDKKEDNKDP
jgi:hypothetical protein